MQIWSSEIKELNQIYQSLKGVFPLLEKELGKLVTTGDENMLLVYSRRCLEVIITELCEKELKRHRGTEPLQRIIDKLNKEEIVPHNIIVSMQNVNSMSTFGAHPKEFELKQVKPVLLNLTTILEWYLKYAESQETIKIKTETKEEKKRVSIRYRKKSSTLKKRIVLLSSVLLVCAAVVVVLNVFDIGGILQTRSKSIESLLILPPGNSTGDETLNANFDGMHTLLIKQIGRLTGLHVKNKTSSDAFKDAGMTVYEIAQKMKVDAVLETIIMSWGDSISLGLELIRGDSKEQQLWNGEFKEEKSKLFNLVNQITKQIGNVVKAKLTPQTENILAETMTVDPKAVDEYLLGQNFLNKIGEESVLKAREHFEEAISIEPEWAAPYAGMAEVAIYLNQMEFIRPSEARVIIMENLDKALKLDPNSAISHCLIATFAVSNEWNWDKGEKEYNESLKLNPNDASCRMFYAHLLLRLNRIEEAVMQAKHALNLGPLDPFILGLYCVVIGSNGDYDSALVYCEKALSIDPDNFFVNEVLGGIYLHLKDYEKYIEWWKKRTLNFYREFWNNENIAIIDKIFMEKGYLSAVREIIKINEEFISEGAYISNLEMAAYNLEIGNFEKAIDYMEKAYDVHNPNMTYLAMFARDYFKLKENQRYIDLMNIMNLPIP